MEKECFENAKAELIEAEKRKRAARQPVMTVSDCYKKQSQTISTPGKIVGFSAAVNGDNPPLFWLSVMLPSPFLERIHTISIPVRREDMLLIGERQKLFEKEITLTLEIPDYD